MERKSTILVTGCQGMTGSALMHLLNRKGYSNVIGIDRTDANLIYTGQVTSIFSKHKPDYVFHVAAKVGGIHANDSQSADFIYENLMMECNVIEAAKEFNVKKLIFCGSACIYPKDTPMPIKEEYLLTGKMEETNIAYAVAKIAGVVMCRMYRKQYGNNFISAMPTNLYGIGDNFHLRESHVLPALIRKFHDAKMNGNKYVEVWGTGEPRREFLNSEDLADALLFLMENYDGAEHVNIGTGRDISIKELVEIIKEVVGYEGTIVWNTDYPDGVYERRLDVTKINSMGWHSKIGLHEGIKRTYNWFITNYIFARR